MLLQKILTFSSYCLLLSFTVFFISCEKPASVEKLSLNERDHVALIGNNLCSRMMNFGHFETNLNLIYPTNHLVIRNMCDGGDTPGFRPHSGRVSPWAFPGAEKFYDELAHGTGSQGHFRTPDEWLTDLKTDVILAFFGYNESFQGASGIENFKNELTAFINHTKSQKYNGSSTPKLVLVSPLAFEDLSSIFDLPNGVNENINLSMYTEAMRLVALQENIPFLDLYTPSLKWINKKEKFTIDGFQLTDQSYKILGEYIVKQLFNPGIGSKPKNADLVMEAVKEKNWMWHNDYKIPNGVHVFGRRYEPFGPDNYPSELLKIRAMTAIRDSAIWEALKGNKIELTQEDSKTIKLPEIQTNYKPKKPENLTYKYGNDALASFTMAPGYKIELFASEQEFPDLANPVQLSFDDKGRLWVAVMPSYPHYKPGDTKPNDKLIILEDTDKDGKADKQTIFAEGLHLPVGFELAPEGVYVSQGTNLKLLKDNNNDDKADEEVILLSGFDDHDTHHEISAFCVDPSGAIYMGEGVFLHSNVETSYGPIRGTNGGFFRYNPSKKHLERTAQLSIPNPWGTGFDKWGQNFFAQTSGPDFYWMMPGSIKPRYGVASPNSRNLIEDEHRVRPTSGVEFVASRHFPDEVQGDFLINNTIGFLGTKQHMIVDDGTGYSSKHRQDLLISDDTNFRPVDMEFAPDGSLYLVDWHNILVGHMQHNARDPLRDHVHGRIYRITYPSRPLVKEPEVYGASINQLLDNLKLPEDRARYRSRRALRGRDKDEVFAALQSWLSKLDTSSPDYERFQLEGLWVSWGINKVDKNLLIKLMSANDYRVRAAAVNVLRYNTDKIENYKDLFLLSAQDSSTRVRLETIVSASWLPLKEGTAILSEAVKYPMDDWIKEPYRYALAHLNDEDVSKMKEEVLDSKLVGNDMASYIRGKEIFGRDGFCITCHQGDGNGLALSGYPPLKDSEWVLNNEEVLILITLKGLYGPIKVLGKEYPGTVPMPPYEGMLNDQDIADVLTFIRNSFGNSAPAVKAANVKFIRDGQKNKQGFYTPEELLKIYKIQ